MSRLLRRYRVVLALLVTFSVGFAGAALATPQSGNHPGITLDVSPNDGNLPIFNTTLITVSGTGFLVNGSYVNGYLTESAVLPNGTTANSSAIGYFTSNADGTFSGQFTVSPFILDPTDPAQQQISCGVVQCYVSAPISSTPQGLLPRGPEVSRYTLNFGVPATTTTTQPTTTTITVPTTTTIPATTTTTTIPATTTTTTTAGDATPPSCAITAVRAGPPKQLDVTAQDTGSGLASITVVSISNGTANVPPVTSGTKSPVVPTFTKTDQTKPTVVNVDVTDVAGNTTHCH